MYTVKLFCNPKEENKKSMDLYASNIAKEINKLVNDEFSISLHSPSYKIKNNDSYHDKLNKYFLRFIKYPQDAAKIRSDVAHITDGSLSHLINTLDPSRTVITCHDIILLKEADGSIPCTNRSKIATLALRYSLKGLRKAQKIITVSETTKRDIIEYGYTTADKVNVIYLGLNPVFKPIQLEKREIRKKFNLPDGKLILHVGVNYSYKNVEAVLGVLRILEQENIYFVKVGDDWTASQSDYIEKHGLAKKIIHLGDRTQEELAAIYNCVDCLLFPSFYEGFGWPPLEALACGTPVIASSAGSIPEIVGDSAILIDPRDINRFANAVRRIFSDKLLVADLKDKGFKQASKFNWENAARQTLNVYTEISKSC